MTEPSPIWRFVRKDCEENPLPSLRTLMARTFKRDAPRHRLPDAAAMLISRPHDPEAAELFLWELLASTAREIDGSLSLGPTFSRAVTELSEDVRSALPVHYRIALEALARMTPLPLADPRTLAHAMVVEDGTLVTWLKGEHPEPKQAKTESGQQVFRQLAKKYHPDRVNGNAEVMSDINQLWRTIKRETT